MVDARIDGLRMVPLRDIRQSDLVDFMRTHAVSRYCDEAPFIGDAPCGYLLKRVVEDAGSADATAVAATSGDRLLGLTVLRFPEWDEEHFGFVVGRVEHLQGVDEEVLTCLVGEAVRQLEARNARMCSARLSGDALAAIHSLEAHGFRFQEQTLNPWYDLSNWDPRVHGVTRPATPEDVPQLRAIARSAFRTDRFHRDCRFDKDKADGVYDKWVLSWHDNSRPGRYSRVLEVQGRVAGLFTFEIIKPHGQHGADVASLGLCGVDPSASGVGNGFRMYCDMVDEAAKLARFAVARVSAANPPVVNLFSKLGFRLTSSGEVTMHWWSED